MLTEQDILKSRQDCYDTISNITENLYLGGCNFKNKVKTIKNNNIVAILAIGGTDEHYDTLQLVEHSKFIRLADDPNSQIIDHFHSCIEFIDTHINNGGVLVHCVAGMSRSATIVAAYLLRKHPSVPTDTMIYYLRNKRCIVDPNYGFWIQLEQYRNKLLAETKSFYTIEYI